MVNTSSFYIIHYIQFVLRKVVMSFLDFSAVGKQFSNKSLKSRIKCEKSRVKHKTEWTTINLTKNFDKVDWHKQCQVKSNFLMNSELNGFSPLFEHRYKYVKIHHKDCNLTYK